MRSLSRCTTFRIEFYFGDLTTAIALEDGQFFKIVYRHEVMAKRIQEIDEAVFSAVVQEPMNRWCGTVALREHHLHQVTLEGVVEKPISGGIRNQDIRLVDRLDMPLLAPSVGRRFFLEVADLTEGRPKNDTTAKPAHSRCLDVGTNSAALRENNAEDVGTVVVAQIYVTIHVGDGQ